MDKSENSGLPLYIELRILTLSLTVFAWIVLISELI